MSENNERGLGNLDTLLTEIKEPDYGTKTYLQAITHLGSKIIVGLRDHGYTVIETTIPKDMKLGSDYDELHPWRGQNISIVLRNRSLRGIKLENKGYINVFRPNELTTSYSADLSNLNLLNSNRPVIVEGVHIPFTHNGNLNEANYIRGLMENTEKQQLKTFLHSLDRWTGGMFQLLHYPSPNRSLLRVFFIDDDNKPASIDIEDVKTDSVARLSYLENSFWKQTQESRLPFKHQDITYSLSKDSDGRMRFSVETSEKKVEACFPERITLEQAGQFANKLKTDTEWIGNINPNLSITMLKTAKNP